MKTVQELCNALVTNQEFKKEFLESAKNGRAEEFLKSSGYQFTTEEALEFLQNQGAFDENLSLEELKKVAGGTNGGSSIDKIINSIIDIIIK